MFNIYTTDKFTDEIFLLTTYTGKVEDIQGTLAVAFANYIEYDETEKQLPVEVDYNPDGSAYFFVDGQKRFLDCYVVGAEGYGFMNLYIENGISNLYVS